MNTVAAQPPVNVTDSHLYLDGIPHDRFAALRAQPGIAWHPYGDPTDDSAGFWAVTRHAEVKEVSKNPEIYSSALGHTNLWDLEADALEARRSLIDTDAPDHTRLRRLISSVFTPKNIRRWGDLTRSVVGDVLDDFEAADGGDWVDLVAAPLPIRVILAILGVPIEDADYLVELSNYLVEGTGDEQSLPANAFGNTTELRLLPFNSPASHAMFEYGARLADLRRHDPQDDMVTMLVQAEADGEKLSASEFRNLFHLLIFAGNETTRTALSHGAVAFAEHPDQMQRLRHDRSIDRYRDRRSASVGHAGAAHATHRYDRRRAGGHSDRSRAEGRHVVRIGEPRRRRLRRTRLRSTSPEAAATSSRLAAVDPTSAWAHSWLGSRSRRSSIRWPNGASVCARLAMCNGARRTSYTAFCPWTWNRCADVRPGETCC